MALPACEIIVANAPFYPHVETKNEKRVEQDIEEGTYHYRPHGNTRTSLRIDEGIQAYRYFDK